jgi:hypothetical protein
MSHNHGKAYNGVTDPAASAGRYQGLVVGSTTLATFTFASGNTALSLLTSGQYTFNFNGFTASSGSGMLMY